MEEYRVPHHVQRLVKLFGVALAGDSSTVLNLARGLEETITSPRSADQQASVNSAIAELKKRSPEERQFETKLEELKARNPHELRSVLQFLGHLAEDPQLTAQLKKQAAHRAQLTRSTEATVEEVVKSAKSRHGSVPVAKVSTLVPGELHSEILLKKQRRDRIAQIQAIEVPDWATLRPNLILGFGHETSRERLGQLEADNLASVPETDQEHIIMNDLLFVLQGIEGENIVINNDVKSDKQGIFQFNINPTLKPTIRELVSRILPMANDYNIVTSFIEERSDFKFGQCSQAFCSAVRSLIIDYLQLLTDLERELRQGVLTMQKFWFYIQPLMKCLQTLASICNHISKMDLLGASILSLLYGKAMQSGDVKSQNLIIFLMERTAKPFFDILSCWLATGVVRDPFLEFMIEESKTGGVNSTDDWDKRYTLRKDFVPEFLYSVSDKILDCGKFLNVISSCAIEFSHEQFRGELQYKFHDSSYLKSIVEAYDVASVAVVNLIMSKFDLVGYLKSLKHYFLIDQGDFLLQFIETAEEELNKPVDDVVPHRLESLLELALRTSTVQSDPHKDNLKVKLVPYSLTSFLLSLIKIGEKNVTSIVELGTEDYDHDIDGFEAFTFDFKFQWPLTLVFTMRAICQYQILFRRLFHCKRVERALCKSWMGRKRTFISSPLRQRMLAFVQNYLYRSTMEVIEPKWLKLLETLPTATNIYDIIKLHQSFLDFCSEECLLTSGVVVKCVDDILRLCLSVAGQSEQEVDAVGCSEQFNGLLEDLLSCVRGTAQQEGSWLRVAYRLDVYQGTR